MLNSRCDHHDSIGEAPKEESQGDMAWTYSHYETLVIPVMVMSLAQTDEDPDGRGDMGDMVDEGNGNEGDEELGGDGDGDGDGDVVNHLHMIAPHERKTIGQKKQCKQKALLDLDWHLVAFIYKALLADGDSQKWCRHQILDDLYGNY